jgi:hypothetical protein
MKQDLAALQDRVRDVEKIVAHYIPHNLEGEQHSTSAYILILKDI